MRNRLPQGLSLLLIVTLLLAGCQSSGAPEVTETEPAPTSTSPLPTEPPPTPTELPPTPTEVPPTATPAFEGLLEYTAAYGGPRAGSWDRDNVERYQAMHPDLEVDYTSTNLYGSPVPNAFYLFLNGDSPPDVFSGFVVGSLHSYVEDGAIADLSDLWAEMGWDEAFPATVREAVTIDGRQYFVPMALQWNPIWYRTDIFEEAGLTPPQTWEEFLAACDTLREAEIVPVAVAMTGWEPPMARWFSILNMRLNGPQFHEALMRGEESYEDPRVRDVFDHLAQLFEHGCFAEETTNYRQAATQIREGEAAMYNLGEWLSESYSDGLPESFDFFSFPVLNPDVPRGEIVHLYGAYMMADAQHPQEARRFLAYLGGVQSQTSNVEALGRVASNLQVDSSLYNDVYRRGLQFVEEADHITQLFEFNAHPDVAGPAMRVFSNYWRNPSEIEEAMASLEEARQQVYGE